MCPFPSTPLSKQEALRLIQILSNATAVDSAVDFLQEEIARISEEDPKDLRIVEYGLVLDALDFLSVRVSDVP